MFMMNNYETILFSNDSSYGGISFIANHIENSCTILVHSVRKDFNSMISNKLFLRKNTRECNDILNNCKRIIVFGTISLDNINISKYRNKEIILIITDSTFLKKNDSINKFLLNNNFIKVLIMPDLIPYINDKIRYKPYFQHINIDTDQPIQKYEELTFSHSPGLKYESDLKGSKFIEKILYDQKLIVIKNKTWSECVETKKKTHIFIDQMIINNEFKYSGGIGKSGLESMLLKNILITSAPPLITEPFFENPPSINIKPDDLRKTIDSYIGDFERIKSVSNKQFEWAKKYTSLNFVKNNILN
tara:strand:- start:1612 stop:2520 length:909 start_codon:yes stop_codon:yes gene_type:complete